MSRVASAVVVGVAWLSLALGPVVGALGLRAPEEPEREPGPAVVTEVSERAAFGRAEPPPAVARSSCGCETVVVGATNIVRDGEIRSGDAEVLNVNLTYIAASYFRSFVDELEVEVDQEADAKTGDALGGQTIGVATVGDRCKNVIVRATNIVQDVEVRSGDATAINRNVVLVDPAVDAEKLDIDVDQDATAEVGHASAGQMIGMIGSTAGRCGRGSVTIEAVNRTEGVEVRTGTATAENHNRVITCAASGCRDELARHLRGVDVVHVCAGKGCRDVEASVLAAQLGIDLTPLPPARPVLDPRLGHPVGPDPWQTPTPDEDAPEETDEPEEAEAPEETEAPEPTRDPPQPTRTPPPTSEEPAERPGPTPWPDAEPTEPGGPSPTPTTREA